MHTKNGKPLQVLGNTLYCESGRVIGRIREDKLFGQDGRYVGTVVGDRLVFRSADSNRVAPAFRAAKRAAKALVNRARSAVRGNEPDIPD